MKIRRLNIWLVLVLVFGFSRFVVAQSKAPMDLERSTFLGRADARLEMKSMVFAFRIQTEQELTRLLAEQQDPRSLRYHQWLTPEEFGRRFGVPEETYQRAVRWLEENGFSVTRQFPNRLRIYFDGTAESAERAFHVAIGLYQLEDKTYYSNDSPPQLPQEFTPTGLGVFELDNFPKEMPLFRDGLGRVAMAPVDMHVAYNLLPLFGSFINGAGQNIAIVARTDFNVSDVQLFRSNFGLPPNDPQKVFVGANPGNKGDGEEIEVLLDAEWSGAMAPNATVQVVISNSVSTSLDFIINLLPAVRIISISFGLGESVVNDGTLTFRNNMFSQAAAQGQTVFVSSGDDGAQQSTGSSTKSTGPDINYLCASPFVTCVGGTELNPLFDINGNATGYGGEVAWHESGGGKSRFFDKPSFQTGPGVPSDSKRDVPDVSVMASPSNEGVFLYRGGSLLCCYGGTSLSAPVWAGVFALVNQTGSPGGTGWANPRIYEMARNQFTTGGPAVFHDITVGNNNTSTVTGFTAGVGYDQVTGWGSFNADLFVRNFAGAPSGETVALISGAQSNGVIPPNPSTNSCLLSQSQYTIDVPAGALQLIINASGNTDVDLFIRYGQRVVDPGGLIVADTRAESSLSSETIYLGPQSTPPLAAGTYYIGIANCDNAQANVNVTANVILPDSSVKIEEMAVDDGTIESGLLGDGIMVVNRVTPSRYPSRLKSIRIFLVKFQGQLDPLNQTIRLVAFADPSGSPRPPTPTPTFLVNQVMTVTGKNGYIDFNLSNNPTINSGDWYIGFQYSNPNNGAIAAGDINGVQRQAGFVSSDDGVTFTGPYTLNSSTPVNFLIRGVSESGIPTADHVNLTVPGSGAISTSTNGANSAVRAGYAVASVSSGNPPYGTAVFSVANGVGVVTSEAGVPASPPTTRGLVFIDYRTAVATKSDSLGAGSVSINTGLAAVNRGTGPANVQFTLRNAVATIVAQGNAVLEVNAHFAKFITELNQITSNPTFNLPADFATATQFGSLDITSNQPLSLLGLRLTTNQRGETLLTSTAIADLTQPLSNATAILPHFADGNGNQTAAILLNTANTTETGKVRFFNNTGDSQTVKPVGGVLNDSFNYSIPPGGLFRLLTDGSPSVAVTGSIQIISDVGTSTPVTAGVFSLSQGGILNTESGVPAATLTTHARVYIDLSGGHNTGLAIAAPSAGGVNATLTAYQTNGTTPQGSPGNVNLNTKGHDAKFADQFISGLPIGFTGVLDISSPTPFAAVTLRSLTNSRGEFLITTFPIADVNQPAPSPIIFPQIADSGGYKTQFIFLVPSLAGGASLLTLNYFGDTGSPITLVSTDR